jgi:hypothetical protein
LVAGLPDLFYNEYKQDINSLRFRNELKHQLNPSDYNFVEYLFLQFDNANLLNLLYNQNKQFNCHAIYQKREIEKKIDLSKELPQYMIDFLKWKKEQDSKEFNLSAENKLHTLFYEYVLQVKNDFLRNWFQFELNTKNLITAINCNKFNYPTENQIILIESNAAVNTLLINNRLKHELFDEELPFSEQIFRLVESDLNLIEKEKALDKIRWNYLDENTFFHYFTIEKVLSYVIKLIIAERWLKLDAKTGKVLLDKLIEELRTSYEFPVEFSLVK